MNQQIIKCCNNTAKFEITYDASLMGNKTFHVCEQCYLQKPYQQFIISVKSLEGKSHDL